MSQGNSNKRGVSWERVISFSVALITGVVHGAVSFGLAYGLVGPAIFTTPFGIFLLFGAVINGFMNFLFYDRDTSRISSWLFSGMRGVRFWQKVNDSTGKKKSWRRLRTFGRYLAGWVGLTELEYQLRMQHLAHYLCDKGSKDFYESTDAGNTAVTDHLQTAYQNDVVANPMGEALSIHDADAENKKVHRQWLAAYLHKLGKGRDMAEERETFLDLVLRVDILKTQFKQPRYSVWVRQAISFVFFVLAVAMSFGLGLVVMVGMEKAFVAFKLTALVAASGAFTTAGVGLVAPLAAIVFCAMTAQLYVTFNEFWTDAYMPGGKTMLKTKFRSWLFGNAEKKDWTQFAKRFLTLSILGAVVAAAVMITWGYFQSFDSGLTRLFNPSEGAPLLHRSAEFVSRVHIFLKVSLLARLKMVLIMMVRGSLEIIGRLVFAGHMVGLLLRATLAKVLPRAIIRDRDEREKVANLWRYRRQYARNFALGILTVINAWMNTYWAKATPHISYTTMCEVGMVQSISLMVRNAMPSWTSTLIGKHLELFSGRVGEKGVPEGALKERLAACDRYLAQCKGGAIKYRTEKFSGYGKRYNRDDLANRALYLLLLLENADLIVTKRLLDTEMNDAENKELLDKKIRVLSHDAIVSLSHLRLLLQGFKKGEAETVEDFLNRKVKHLYKALYQRHMVSPGFVKLKNYFRRFRTWTFRKTLIAVGAGGAIWWVYPFLSKGLLPWLPGIAVWAPVLPWVFLAASLIAMAVVAHYILKDTRSKTLRVLAGRPRNLIDRPVWRKLAMSTFKTLGAGGMLWAFISMAMTFTPMPIIPAVVLTTIVLGMGWTVLAELSSAFRWGQHFPVFFGFVQQSTDAVLKVFGSVAAIWFLWSITQLIPPVAAAVLASPLLLNGIAFGVAALVGVGVLIGMAVKLYRSRSESASEGEKKPLAVDPEVKVAESDSAAVKRTPFFQLVHNKITSLEQRGAYMRVSLGGRDNADREKILGAIQSKENALCSQEKMDDGAKDQALFAFLQSAMKPADESTDVSQSDSAKAKAVEAGRQPEATSSLAGFFARAGDGSQLKRAIEDVVMFVPGDDELRVASAAS